MQKYNDEISDEVIVEQFDALFRRCRTIFVKSEFIDICDSTPSAMVLTKIYYWYRTMNGIFYKTDQEFAHELNMGVDQFRAAKKSLINKGYISVCLKGVPAKSYYKFNISLVFKSLTHVMEVAQTEDVKSQVHVMENTQNNHDKSLLINNLDHVMEVTQTEDVSSPIQVMEVTQTTTKNTYIDINTRIQGKDLYIAAEEKVSDPALPGNSNLVSPVEYKNSPAEYPAAFEEFYDNYPTHPTKFEALRKRDGYYAWLKHCKEVGEETLLECAKRYKRYLNGSEKVYRPDNWFSKGAWLRFIPPKAKQAMEVQAEKQAFEGLEDVKALIDTATTFSYDPFMNSIGMEQMLERNADIKPMPADILSQLSNMRKRDGLPETIQKKLDHLILTGKNQQRNIRTYTEAKKSVELRQQRALRKAQEQQQHTVYDFAAMLESHNTPTMATWKKIA